MTSSSTEMDLAKLLSHLDINEVHNQSLPSSLNVDCLQRFNSAGLRPDGRRLLGRSMTTTSPKTPVSQTLAFLYNDPTEDAATEIPECFRTHRKLDRSVSEPHPSVLSTRSGSSCSSSSSSSRYKTELCRPFEENGSCKYGEKCQFAHGRHELRTVARHPKYKTDLCKTYHTTGLCPYGPRCHFIHNDDERCLNVLNRMLLRQQMEDSLMEKAQLQQKQQVIAAALATQKALLQQAGARKPLLRHTSSDGTELHPLPFSFVHCDPVGSSLSDSSSSTNSPTPSPTSSMFSEDPSTLTGASALAGGVYHAPGQGAFRFNPAEVTLYQTPFQNQQTEPVQPSGTNQQTANPLLLLMAKLQQTSSLNQQEVDNLLKLLTQKTSSTSISSATASPSISSSIYSNAGIMSPYSPSANISAADFLSRDTSCFSFPYSTVEL